MFQIDEDKTIYITRGDIAFFSVTAESNGELYKFQKGDVVRMKVMEKKNCSNVAFQKDFPVLEECDRVNILLTEEETKIGEVISKARDYWYEIELNPYTNPQTIIGYDDDGAKIFKLFPEGRDLGNTTRPEDIPAVDSELSLTSTRPVENQAITRAFLSVSEKVDASKEKVDKATEDVNVLLERMEEILGVSNFKSGVKTYELTHEEDDHIYKSTATVMTNGVAAVVHLNRLQSKSSDAQNGATLYELPEELCPLGMVTVLTIENEEGSDIKALSICADESKCALTYYGNTEGSSYMNRYFFYPLKNAGLAEVADARVGADGTVYGSLGEAIREQVKNGGGSGATAEQLAQIQKNKEDISQLSQTVNDLKENGTGGCLLTVETITIGENTGGDDTGETVPVESLTLDYTTLSLNVGDSIQLACSVNPSNATNTAILWESSDDDIAKVDNGYVTAIASGNVIITAKSAENTSIKATCSVNVAEESSGGDESETVKVYLSEHDVVNGTLYRANGNMGSISNGCSVEIPYYEGMYIITNHSSSWVTNYPPFVVYDNGAYSQAEYTEYSTSIYQTTLTGYSENAKVYVNIKGNLVDGILYNNATNIEEKCYYSYET